MKDPREGMRCYCLLEPGRGDLCRLVQIWDLGKKGEIPTGCVEETEERKQGRSHQEPTGIAVGDKEHIRQFPTISKGTCASPFPKPQVEPWL